MVDSAGADPFVPEGKSVWEISVRKDVVQKADEDYQKRTENPLGLDPAEMTFVFSTSRVFPDKEGWVALKLSEGVWSDVKVVDADDLEAWLERVPAVVIAW